MNITIAGLIEARAAGFGLNDLIVLAVLNDCAWDDADTGRVADSATWELAQRTGLSKHQVEHAVAKLAKAGAVARRQLVKRAGESALTLICDLGRRVLGEANAHDVPADMPQSLRNLLVGRSAAFRLAVREAWESRQPLAPGARDAFAGLPREFDAVESALRENALCAMERISTEIRAQQQLDLEEANGLYTFETDDGVVQMDRRVLVESKAAPAGIDLRFVRDVLSRVRSRRPGLVTRARLPELVAEIGYSRLLGFVSRHDAAHAERALVATLSRGGWSRPRGIRDSFYSLTRSSVRYPQGGDRCVA